MTSLPPTVAITAPVEGGIVQIRGRVYITFTASDDSGLVVVYLTVDGQPLPSPVVFDSHVTETSIPWDVPKKPGQHVIEATAYDSVTGSNGSYSYDQTGNSATASVTVTAVK